MANKNDNFSHFAKHRLFKKPQCCNPPLDPKLVCFFFIKKRNIDVEQKTNFKIRENKDKERGFREIKEETKKEKELMKINCVIEYIDVVLFMKQKQTRNKKKERDKNKEPKENKKERQEGRKKRKRERQRKRK